MHFKILVTVFLANLTVLFAKRIPENPCPHVFSYFKKPENGEIYGEARVPYDGNNKLEFSVNASLAGYFHKADLRIQVATPSKDIQKSTIIKYNIFFPFRYIIPKITQVQYNKKIFCSGPPEPLVPGTSGVTNVWASHIYSFSTVTNRDGENNENAIIIGKPNDGKPETSDKDIPTKDPDSPNLSTNFQDTNPYLTSNTAPITQAPARPTVPRTDQNTPPPNTNANKNFECGKSNDAIVPLVLGGDEVSDSLFPWLVAMFVSKGNSYEYKCTANLISEEHVVTAARCVQYFKVQIVKNEDMLFILGKADVSRWATNGAVTRGAKLVQTHPEYNQKTAHGDISVITLDKPVQFSKSIAPICLWAGDADLTEVINQKGTLAGWGTDEGGQKAGALSIPVARYVDIPVVSQEDCLYSNFTFGTLTTEMTFCAGSRDGKGPCIGDSGAGFTMQRQGKYYLRGLVSIALSNSQGKCDLNSFIIFCDAAKFQDWIRQCIKK